MSAPGRSRAVKPPRAVPQSAPARADDPALRTRWRFTRRHRVALLWLAAMVVATGATTLAARLREAQWQDRLDQAVQASLQQAWSASTRQAHERLLGALDRLRRPAGGDAAAALADRQLAQRAAAEGLAQVDLYDPAQRLQASSAGVGAAQALVDAAALQALRPPSRPQRAGVRLREAGREAGGSPALYVLARRLDDGSVLAAAVDLRPLLQAAGAQLGSPLALTSPRGLLLDGAPVDATRRQVLPLGGLEGTGGRPAALLLVQRPALADAPPPSLAALAWLALLPLSFVAGLVYAVRRLMGPLLRPVQVVEALADGHLQAGADDVDTLADDETGRLARAAERLRTELRALGALREERQRVARQQTRLLRHQMRALAETLHPAGRAEILDQLADEGTGDGQPQLARLATLLERLTGLVGRQQGRLLELLRELQASVQTREQLASLQQELEIARRLQQAILPRGAPPLAQLALQATMIPAREVGGDFYDWFMLDEHRLALVVADVSGKGVPAAFFMAVTRTLLRSTAAFVGDPAQVVARLNDELAADNDETLFVTLFYAVLDVRTGVLDSVNAGHNPPLLRRADGHVEALPRGRNPVLAAFPGLAFEADRCTLAPGDGLLLYTDGVTEAQNAAGGLFGEAALVATLADAGAQPVQPIVAAVRRFEAGAAQADDITCVWLRYGAA